MEIQFNEMVPADELSLNPAPINDKLSQHPKIFVFDNNRPQFVIMSLEEYESLPQVPKKSQKPAPYAMDEDVKIGTLVQDAMRHLIQNDVLPDDEIRNLTDPIYCSKVFGLSFSVLKEYEPDKPFVEQKRDTKGYNRYYNFRLFKGDTSYLLCSQWVEGLHRQKFKIWLSQWE